MKIVRAALVFSFCTSVVLTYQACSGGFETIDENLKDIAGSESLASADLKTQTLSIFAKNCQTCHDSSNLGGTTFNFADDLNKIAASKFVVAGQPMNSEIYQRIAESSMPPGAPLNSDQQRVIAEWITSLAATPTPTPTPSQTPTPAPTATPSLTPVPTATPSMATFTYAYNNLLVTCGGCHGTAGGYTLKTYNDFLKIIVKGNANQSLLYGVIAEGRMPPGRTVSAQDKKAIYDWIQTGAPNN